MNYQGRCHCGRVRFEVEAEPGPVVECNCTHCRRKGYLLWFVPRAQVRLATPEFDLATYTFNRHVIRHHFCPTCGCAPFGFGTNSAGEVTAAVNVRCLDGLDIEALARIPYDGLAL